MIVKIILGTILAGILLLLLLAFITGASLTIGMRNKQDAYYDPETKQWYPKMYMTEEQISRIRKGKRKLAKRKC